MNVRDKIKKIREKQLFMNLAKSFYSAFKDKELFFIAKNKKIGRKMQLFKVKQSTNMYELQFNSVATCVFELQG